MNDLTVMYSVTGPGVTTATGTIPITFEVKGIASGKRRNDVMVSMIQPAIPGLLARELLFASGSPRAKGSHHILLFASHPLSLTLSGIWCGVPWEGRTDDVEAAISEGRRYCGRRNLGPVRTLPFACSGASATISSGRGEWAEGQDRRHTFTLFYPRGAGAAG
jgi:hypothetical protein